jgi:hypothetical protein
MSIDPKHIRDALDLGHLVAKQLNGRGKKLIPVFGGFGLQAWYENHWLPAQRKTS